MTQLSERGFKKIEGGYCHPSGLFVQRGHLEYSICDAYGHATYHKTYQSALNRIDSLLTD